MIFWINFINYFTGRSTPANRNKSNKNNVTTSNKNNKAKQNKNDRFEFAEVGSPSEANKSKNDPNDKKNTNNLEIDPTEVNTGHIIYL